MLFVTVVYFLVSRKAYSLTMSLRGMLLPDNLQTCLRSIAAVFATLIVFCTAGGTLVFMGLGNVFCICAVSLVAAIALDWKLFKGGESGGSISQVQSFSKNKTVSIIVLVAAIVFRGYTSISAVAIQPLPVCRRASEP